VSHPKSRWRTATTRCASLEDKIVESGYSDDFVMGFESDARWMMAALQERLAKFGLAIHEEKTRLLESQLLS
jgi:hypothetical protein